MPNGRDDNLRAWLEAEAAGESDKADAMFASVFALHVPALAPQASVWDRVAAGLEAAWFRSPWARAAAVVLVALGGLAAAAFASTWVFDLLGAAGAFGPRMLRVAMTTSGLTFDSLAHAWGAAAAIGRALAVAAATGPAAAAIAANLTIALAASLGLSRLLSLEKE